MPESEMMDRYMQPTNRIPKKGSLEIRFMMKLKDK
jgi:hypothetical protein